jgi:hypothetical protein
MKQVVFMSAHRDLSVPFVVAQGKDARGYPTSGKPAIQFKDWRCVINVDEEPDKLERLREAPGNMKNRGNSFWEVSEEELNEATLGDGGYAVSEPDNGVTEADTEALNYLDNLPAAIPPKATEKALGIALTIYERFRVRGIPRPTEADKPLHLRSKVVLMIDAIKTKGLYGDSSGEADSTGGKEEDK